MDELMPRMSGPEAGFAFPSGTLGPDGWPERWDSLCCDQIFANKATNEAFEAVVLPPGLGTSSGQLDLLKVRTAAAPATAAADAPHVETPVQRDSPVANSASSHGATNSQAVGMSLRSGQVKSHASVSRADEPTDSDTEQQPCSSLPQKRRRRRKADADEYVYAQHSDPEERKLEKRRAKNRRTARASRERKQAELLQMKTDLANKTSEVARLQAIIAAKDEQIAQLALKRELRRLFEQVPAAEQQPMYRKMQELLLGHRSRRRDKSADSGVIRAEVSDESDTAR